MNHNRTPGVPVVADAKPQPGDRERTAGVRVNPAWCPVHEHYKWCEHNGGVLGPNGWQAPSGVPASEQALRIAGAAGLDGDPDVLASPGVDLPVGGNDGR